MVFGKCFYGSLLNFVSFCYSAILSFCPKYRKNIDNDKFFRISRPKVFYIKGVIKNFAKFTVNTCVGVSFLIKSLRHRCSLKNTYFHKTPPVLASCFPRFDHQLPTIYVNLNFLSVDFPLFCKDKLIKKLSVAEQTLSHL